MSEVGVVRSKIGFQQEVRESKTGTGKAETRLVMITTGHGIGRGKQGLIFKGRAERVVAERWVFGIDFKSAGGTSSRQRIG